MTLFAHAGHWIAQLLYLAPVVAMIAAIVWAQLRRRAGSTTRVRMATSTDPRA